LYKDGNGNNIPQIPVAGNWTLHIRCQGCSYWHMSNVFGISTLECDEGCSWLSHHYAFWNQSFSSPWIVAPDDSKINFIFYTQAVPDRLIVHVNSSILIDTIVSSTRNQNYVNNQYPNCGAGGCSQNVCNYDFEICVNQGDSIKYTVIQNPCNGPGTLYTLKTECSGVCNSSFNIAPKVTSHNHSEIIIPPKEDKSQPDSLTQDSQMSMNISIIPNPADNYVDIIFSDLEELSSEIGIFSTSGQLVHKGKKESQAKSVRIDTQELIDGLYFIRIQDGNESQTHKLIITHN